MKLRVRGNSVRMRVTQGELRQMGETGQVRDGADFAGGGRLGYALLRDDAAAGLSASFEGGTVTVRLPGPLVDRWVATNLVSLEGEQPIGDGTLKILVEKDFACLEPRPGEDDSDMFDHPDAGSNC